MVCGKKNESWYNPYALYEPMKKFAIKVITKCEGDYVIPNIVYTSFIYVQSNI